MKFVIRRHSQRLAAAAIVAVLAVLAASAVAVFARDFWLSDLLVHFRVQYAGIALLAGLWLAWARRPGWVVVALLVFAVNMRVVVSVLGWDTRSAVAPAAAAAASHASVTHSVRVRLVSINVLYHNTDYQRVIDFLRKAHPDAAVLVEVTPRWRRALRVLHAQYPQSDYASAILPRITTGRIRRGVLLLSRWPLTQVREIPLGANTEPAVSATLTLHGRTLHLMGVHTRWPMGPRLYAERNRQLALIAAHARAIRGPLAVMGDFNISPFSPHFRALLARSGLERAARGAGWQPSWPTFLPLAGIQIDHALVSPQLHVLRFARGPYVGSDHRPLVVDLEF